jgi:ketosteroid isomerase-like protein
MDNLAVAQRLTDAWNQGDITTVLALVTPDVEFVTPGGVDHGPEAARRWVAKQTQPHAVMHIVVEQLLEAGDCVVVLSRRQMRWQETGELADETPGAALMTFRVGKLHPGICFSTASRRSKPLGSSRLRQVLPAGSNA